VKRSRPTPVAHLFEDSCGEEHLVINQHDHQPHHDQQHDVCANIGPLGLVRLRSSCVASGLLRGLVRSLLVFSTGRSDYDALIQLSWGWAPEPWYALSSRLLEPYPVYVVLLIGSPTGVHRLSCGSIRSRRQCRSRLAKEAELAREEAQNAMQVAQQARDATEKSEARASTGCG